MSDVAAPASYANTNASATTDQTAASSPPLPAPAPVTDPDANAWLNGGGNDWFSGGDDGDQPVVLDLTGHGITITQLTSSNHFTDMTGDGYQNRTAWAGTGNAVLFFDPNNTNQITQANQIIFTDWDPSAAIDMQALADVFDTNHDGSLDAGDADFSQFKLMVTNADGTSSVETLAQAGITAISLTANNVTETFADGSSVDGETTYTTLAGTTGTAATVTFADDANGYVVTTTTTTNGDGSTTVSNVADNADGSLAFTSILNTAAGGQSKTLSQLDNGGVVTALQTDVTVVSNGVTTETLTNYANGAVQSNGELTSAGVAGDEKLNSTTTVTNGSTVTINRDQLGGGWTTQKEVQTFSGDARVSDVLSDLNPDGSASRVTTTTSGNGGLTQTATTLIDGIAADSTTTVDATVIGAASGAVLSQRTETVTASKGTTTVSATVTVTQTTANAVTATTSKYLTDGSTLDGTTVQTTVTNPDGSATTTQIDSAANGAFIDETVSTIDATGLLKSTSTDANGGGTAAAPVFTSLETDDTVVNGDGSRTETVTDDSQNNVLQSQVITTRAASGPARSVTIYATGDGEVSQTELVTVNAANGAVTDTLSNFNGDGSLANQTVTTTSANGLSKTTQVDTTGTVFNGASVFDHTTSHGTVHNADGSTMETVTVDGATTSNAISKTVTTATANGLSTRVDSAFTAGSLAGGTWDAVTTDVTVVNSGGSLTETITDDDGYGNVLDTTVKQTSANRQTVTTTTTLGTTNLVKTAETVATQANGSVIDTTIRFDESGDVLGATVTTTSADGLTRTTQNDIQGQTASAYAASSLAFDQTTSDVTVINADGSRTETVNVTSHNGTLEQQSVASTAANGLTVTTTSNPFATAHYATETTDVTTYNTDGSTTETVSNYNYSSGLIDQTATTTAADGLSTTTTHDLDGAGVEQSTTDVTTINANGSRTQVVTDYTGSTTGTLRDVTTTTSGIILAGAGDETTVTRQSNGSVAFYTTETIAPIANGTVSNTTQVYASQGGALLLETQQTTSANGLVKTSSTAVNGDTSWDFSTKDTTALNTDGSTTETVATSSKSGLIDETVTTISANGLSKIISVDANGAANASGAVFNRVTTDTTVLNSNGSRTETVAVSNANAAEIEQTVTSTSADRQTMTTNRYLDETGSLSTADQTETRQTQATGAVVDTTVSYSASDAVVDTVTRSTSGNGLVTTTTYVNGAGTTTDSETDTTTYDANGDGGTLRDDEHSESVGGSTLSSSSKLQSSANGQFETITQVLTGALAVGNGSSFKAVAQQSTVIADSGVTTRTTTDTLNGAASAADTTIVVTSADGLVTTTSTALGTANPYIVTSVATNLDGSKTATSTTYNPATMGNATPTIAEQTVVNTSWDGRTVVTTRQSDFDGTNYTVETIKAVANANGTETTTRSGSGSFGAGGFSVTSQIVTNADASMTTVTQNDNAANALIGQTVTTTAANGLKTAFVVDTSGAESLANMEAAASDLMNGTALPSGLLSSDILGLDVKGLNADGSVTETDNTYYGSLSTLRSSVVTTTSANGLVTVKRTDGDGNGIVESVDTTTLAPDGSKSETVQYYGNGGPSAGQLTGSSTLTTSADGLVTVLTTSTGATDTTTTFANANGSYQWSRVVQSTSSGLANGSATHDIDANGMDSWSWSDGSAGGTAGTVTIDVATETQDIAQANMITTTVLGHSMTDAETQYVAQYIANGTLNRSTLADALVGSAEYKAEFAGVPLNYSGLSYQVAEDFLNVLGRLPTASELAQFAPSSLQGAKITTQTLANTAIAVAQYAADWTGGGPSELAGSGQGLLASFAAPVGAAQTYALVTPQSGGGGGGSSFWDQLWNALEQNGVTIDVSSDVDATLPGTNDTLDLYGSNDTVTISGASNNVVADGTGMVVNADSTNDSATITNGQVNVGANDQATVDGNNNTVTQGAGSTTTLDGNGDTDTATGTGGSVTIGGTGENLIVNGFTVNDGSYSGNQVAGSGNTIDLTTNSGANIQLTQEGSSGFTVDAIGDVIELGANTGVTITGNNDSIVGQRGGDTINVSGTGDYLTVNGDTINGGSFTGNSVAGAGDTINLSANSGANYDVTQEGNGGFTVNAIGDVIELGANTGVTVTGNNDSIVGQQGGDTINVNGTGDYLTVNGDTISDVGYDGNEIAGAGDTVNLGGGVSIGMTEEGSGSFLVNGSGDVIGLGANTGVTVRGNSDSVVGQSGGDSIAADGTGDYLTVNGDTVYDYNYNNQLAGAGDTVFLADGVNFGATQEGGSGFSFHGTGDVIGLGANTNATFYGNQDNIEGTSGSDVISVAGDHDYIEASNDEIVIDRSNEYVTVGSGDTVLVYGSGDSIVGSGDSIHVASGDTAYIDGTNDAAYGSADWYGSTSGDTDNGNSVGSSGGEPPQQTSTPTNWGFAVGVVRQMNTIAEYDLSNGFNAAAVAADASWSRANQAIAAAGDSALVAPSPFNGYEWTPGVITWSFAADAGDPTAPFSGSIDAQYQSIFEQAIQTWAAATGLTFQQVSGSTASDIEIGWGDLQTSESGSVGYTSWSNQAGVPASAIVRIEDPTEDPLVAGADGSLTYAGTQAELSQVALHEIGHALGLGESSDPNSIMFPLLGPANATLDASDITNIQALYGSNPSQQSMAALIQAMASFGAPSSPMAQSVLMPLTQSYQSMIAAASH